MKSYLFPIKSVETSNLKQDQAEKKKKKKKTLKVENCEQEILYFGVHQ